MFGWMARGRRGPFPRGAKLPQEDGVVVASTGADVTYLQAPMRACDATDAFQQMVATVCARDTPPVPPPIYGPGVLRVIIFIEACLQETQPAPLGSFSILATGGTLPLS